MFDASTLEVFIASTNDLTEERGAVEEVLRDWNSRESETRQIILKPIRWEEDATPELGPGSFQAVINANLLDPADILIGIVGKRLGSPTGKSIAGTVEEIERFAAARKPVLLYFSDRQYNLSDIDTVELDRVDKFRLSMQQKGLYRTFKDIADFKKQLRGHLDTLLKDFQALLIPAGHALAYGYYKNFVAPTHSILRGLTVDLPDFKLSKSSAEKADQQAEMTLSFSSFRIMIAKPASWEDATDNAVFALKNNLLSEINVKTHTLRRAFRVYVRKATRQFLDDALKENLERVSLDRLDVLDFPTPMIALHEFVKYVEKSIIKRKVDQGSAAGYWQKQKTVQYNAFFESFEYYRKEDGMKGICFFDFRDDPGFKLPD